MKHLPIFFAASAIVLLSACQSEQLVPAEAPQTTEETVTITGYLPSENNTKTIRDANGKIFWLHAEEISLFYASGDNGGSKFTSTNVALTSKAQFTGTIGVITGGSDENDGVDQNWFWGLYPYDATASCDGTYVYTTMMSSQVAQTGSFGDDTFITLGRSQGLSMSFYNVCGGIGFSVTRSDIKRVVFKGNEGEALGGRIKIGMGDDGKPFIAELSDGFTEIELTAPDGGTFTAGEYYYIPTVPVSLPSGFTLEFYTANAKGTYSFGNSLTVARSGFKRKASADAGIEFEAMAAPDWDVSMNVYTKAVGGVIKGYNPNCSGITRVTSVEETTERLYNSVGYSKDDFHALFSTFVGNNVVHCPDNTNPMFQYFKDIDCVGEVIENAAASETAHVLTWTVTATDIWRAMYVYEYFVATNTLPTNMSTDSLYHYSYYKNPTSGNTVVIRLAAAFDDFNTNIPTANFVSGYWKEEASAPNGVATEFNVAVPDATYPLNMDYLKSNLHSMFVKYPSTHATAANQTFVDPGITDVNFYFDAVQIAKINKIGKYYATFKTNYSANAVKADPDLNMDCLELFLVKFGPDKEHAITVNVKIAEIYNEAPWATAPRWSQVWYGGNNPEDYGLEFGFGGEDGPSYADSLLNTGAMYTYFGAWGEVCDDADLPLFISFGDARASSFRGNFIRPINATTQTSVPFIDQLTYGYPGSYINVKDLVDLYDWRGNKFANEQGLWDYYGIDTIIVMTEDATTDGGFNTAGTLSGDIQLIQRAASDFNAKYWDANDKVYKNYPTDMAPYGYLTYKNIGSEINTEYHIWVPVKINYDWGWYETAEDDMIKITVKPAE